MLGGQRVWLCVDGFWFGDGLFWFWPAVVVGYFDSNVSSILASARQALPEVVLAATRDDDVAQIDPCLANQLGLLVIVENGQLKLEVVWTVMDGEAQFLVPRKDVSAWQYFVMGTNDTGPGLPSRGLATTNIGGGLLCFLAEAGGAVGVLLANGLAVGQVLCAVDNENESANDRAVDAHVGKNARRVRPTDEVCLAHGRCCIRAQSWPDPASIQQGE